MTNIDANTKEKAKNALIEKFGADNQDKIATGVDQAASFWRESDGTNEDFVAFCSKQFVADDKQLDALFDRLQHNYEIISGHFNAINRELNVPLALEIGEIIPVDYIYGAYSPSAHLADDFFKNKLAFIMLLNFQFYSLDEKIANSDKWTRKQWAYARMGDMFTSRVPGDLSMKVSEVMTDADAYISDYNIYVGYLTDGEKDDFFKKDMKLITHWNLRDEIKSQYSQSDGLPKQEIIYEVMKRIVTQTIPEQVINSNEYVWNPYENKIYKDGKEAAATDEPNTRYQKLLNAFHAMRAIDEYSPFYPTYIERKFSEELEMPQAQVEKLFKEFISSPVAKQVGALIKKRLGRDLKPFDIWYDGFKARSTISQDDLSKQTKAKYPTPAALKADLPRIMKDLGFTTEKANSVSARIDVDPSRGAGHALGAQMKSDNAHLRTRIGSGGMDYKGYNIAVHEFGHNVEQTITLQDVDYYMLNGVPNTAFTEAWAFVFQSRDLELLGIKDNNPDKKYLSDLDNYWSTYEIMGVALVDMEVWKWLYKNPNANAEELKVQTIKIATEIWNEYYAPVIGVKDTPILGIYSHMIDYPLYLSAYPIGHLIEFQMEEYMDKLSIPSVMDINYEGSSDVNNETNMNIGQFMEKMLVQGRIIPNAWMKGAVGSELSIAPFIRSTEEALKVIKD
jgi:hypothetical protein